LPHRLARLCELIGARLVHFSTDCVFDGAHGSYTESDRATADDVYGRSKLLGEVDAPHAVTLRTSMIGPELGSYQGLLEWFLAQKATVRGFRRAIFSGVTTLELARVVRDHILPRPDLRGVYHVGAEAISKFDLLTLIGRIYGHDVPIDPDDTFVIDRSLDSSRFRLATGYRAPSWSQMITEMRDSRHVD
jgi:dTDP-4-dehydrorhamnose reductase